MTTNQHNNMYFLFILTLVSSECSQKLFFTECTDLDTRKAIISSEGDCENPGLKVYENLECDFSCGPGYFLNFLNGEQTCSECPIGTYSLGSSQVFGIGGTPWAEALPTLINQCWTSITTDQLDYNCNKWLIQDNYLVSGKSLVNSTFISSLKFEINLVKPGKLSIIYRKQVETQSDLLEFSVKINKVSRLNDENAAGKIWNSFEQELEVGRYQIEIDCLKDPGEKDENVLAIHSIVVEGALFNSECLKCHSSVPLLSGDSCMVCDYNQYYFEGSCQDCPANTYSHRGSTNSSDCLPRFLCSMKDFVQLYSPCVNSARKMYFEWKNPVFCDYLNYQLPPSIDNLPCEPCPSGYIEHQNGEIKECKPCAEGEYVPDSNSTKSSCLKCPSGSLSLKSISFSNWTEIPYPFTTYTKEANGRFSKLYDGWLPMSEYLSTGQISQNGLHFYLEATINIKSSEGHFSFTYQIMNKQSGSFELYINRKLFKYLTSIEETTEKISLPVGESILELVYIKVEDAIEEVRIKQISIVGSEIGGASECTQCPVGYINTGNSTICLPCPVGYSSNPNNTLCIECLDGSTSPFPGNECFDCPSGSTNNINHSLCVATSYINFTRSSYFLYALANMSLVSEQENVCSSLSSQLYCYDTFYGPIDSKEGEYYLSIINPSLLELPGIPYLGSPSVGYSFAVFKTKSSIGTDDKDVCNKEERIVNLGKEYANVQESLVGYTIDYANGDLCGDGNRYSSRVHIICDKSEEYGWPAVNYTNNCSVSFIWKSKYGCKLCSDSEMKKVTGECKNGQQEVSVIEGENCISVKQYEKTTQACLDEEFKSELFIIYFIIGFCGLLTIPLIIFHIKSKKLEVPLVDLVKPKTK